MADRSSRTAPGHSPPPQAVPITITRDPLCVVRPRPRSPTSHHDRHHSPRLSCRRHPPPPFLVRSSAPTRFTRDAQLPPHPSLSLPRLAYPMSAILGFSRLLGAASSVRRTVTYLPARVHVSLVSGRTFPDQLPDRSLSDVRRRLTRYALTTRFRLRFRRDRYYPPSLNRRAAVFFTRPSWSACPVRVCSFLAFRPRRRRTDMYHVLLGRCRLVNILFLCNHCPLY